MQRFLILSALVAYASGNIILPRTALPDGRIVGGNDTTIQKYPHQVSLRVNNRHFCGANIINNRTVVTAAHCCDYAAENYTIKLGVTNLGSISIVLHVQEVIRHPDYSSNTLNNDVCILKLKEYIPYSDSVQSIELVEEEPEAGTSCVVIGWGYKSEGGSLSNILQETVVIMIDRKQCNDIYYMYGGIDMTMTCAGVPEGGKDTCQGDSGGPLISGNKLAGIVSWGVGCGRPQYPGVYTNVAPLRSWMLSQ